MAMPSMTTMPLFPGGVRQTQGRVCSDGGDAAQRPGSALWNHDDLGFAAVPPLGSDFNHLATVPGNPDTTAPRPSIW